MAWRRSPVRIRYGPPMINKPSTLLPSSNPPKKYVVRINYVRDVTSYDYPQARKAWDALVEAGIDPGALIAAGLNEGHGYNIDSFELVQSFDNSFGQDLMGETLSTEDSLVGYKYSSSKRNLILSESPKNSSNSPVVIKTQQLTRIEAQELDTVEMVAVISKKINLLD